jgi:hypothetical protein
MWLYTRTVYVLQNQSEKLLSYNKLKQQSILYKTMECPFFTRCSGFYINRTGEFLALVIVA